MKLKILEILFKMQDRHTYQFGMYNPFYIFRMFLFSLFFPALIFEPEKKLFFALFAWDTLNIFVALKYLHC